MPLFCRISQDPFDSSCIIIETYKKVFTARNDQRVVGAIVGGTIVMEPIGRGWEDELARVVTASSHGCADDVSQVKRLQHVTVMAINFPDCGLEIARRIRLKE